MTLKGYNEENGWISIDYAATWRYGYDFMLDAAQSLLPDFGDDLQRVAKAETAGEPFVEIIDELKACGGKLRECKALSGECGVIAIAGISAVMECPMQIVFYNQTNYVRLDIPIAQIPEGTPARKIFDERGDGYQRTFDCFMDSIEIKAYCADTERRTIAKMMSDK